MIEEGLEQYKKTGCQFVIGIGGGSPLDSAKAIAAMAVNEGRIADYNGKEITGSVPGIVAIPTTSGTGSEATKFTVITDQEKDIRTRCADTCRRGVHVQESILSYRCECGFGGKEDHEIPSDCISEWVRCESTGGNVVSGIGGRILYQ